jgi:hypothetical protein
MVWQCKDIRAIATLPRNWKQQKFSCQYGEMFCPFLRLMRADWPPNYSHILRAVSGMACATRVNRIACLSHLPEHALEPG